MNTIYNPNGTEIERRYVLGAVPETWHPIVNQLIDDLFAEGWDGVLHQIKEKFGGLRFYIAHGSDKMFALIDEAEDKTEQVCIQCGKPATTTTTGWVTNVCDEHKE